MGIGFNECSLLGIASPSGGSSGMDRLMHIKVYITSALVLLGALLGSVMAATTNGASQAHAEGILIDFKEYDVVWYEADYRVSDDPVNLLEKACEANAYTYTFDTEGKLTEVNGVSDTDVKKWGLWYVSKGSTDWTKSDTYDVSASDYAATVWAYRQDGEVPTVAVDATGVCVYGYERPNRIVSLSPVSTETLCAIGAADAIVGVDFYSNYPNKIAEEKANGMIAVVGTYTDPSFEIIMKQSPDMIVSDGSQYNQLQVADTVRSNGTNAVVIYDGEDIKTIYDNTFLVGKATNYDIASNVIIDNDNQALSEISEMIGAVLERKSVMVALSTDISPYVAGDRTYVSNIMEDIEADNAFASFTGWCHINTGYIARNNPDIIIVVTDSYDATQSEWDIMYSNLGDTWKSTTAYENKDIYLLCGKTTDLASRSAPRFVQLAELMAYMIYPDLTGTSVPKFIGSEYKDYLTITAELGYDN